MSTRFCVRKAIRLFLSINFILPTLLFSQVESHGLVEWLTFKEAQEKNKVLEKPMLIDIYTDWCGWCKHMMRTTYSNPNIAGYINAHFYPIKFDAEGKDTIEFNGKIYKPTSPEPKTPHELAIQFIGSRLSYPSTCFVTNNYQYNLLSQGYLEDKKIEPLLVFFVENAWRNATYDDFSRHFQHAFYDTAYAKGTTKTQPITDLEKLTKKKKKKSLVFINSGFCNTGKVMEKTTFNDTSLVSYLNNNYYYSEFDVSRTDTINFKSVKYGQVLVNNYPIHSLALKLTNNGFSLPALCVLDEDLNPIQVINFYLSPETLNPLLRYFGSDSYKTMPFQQYVEEQKNKGKKSRP